MSGWLQIHSFAQLRKPYFCKFVQYCIMKQRIVFIFCLLWAGLPAFSQSRDSIMIRNIVTEAMVNGQAYEQLRYLCKEIGPRLSGSANAAKAVDATANMLREAGADTVYLQPCMVPHWERGEKETGRVILTGNQSVPLHLSALGNSVATPQGGISAQVVEVQSMAELHRLGEKGIKGKIVFFNLAMNPAYIRTFNAYGESGIGRRIGPAQASRYGAIGVLVRSLASNPDDYPHTGATQYNDSFPKIPAAAISTNDANSLSMWLKTGKAIETSFETHCRMLPDVLSYNVIGEIRGTEYPREIITVGGHLDSWDLGEGAQDDGAGCMQAIEIIRTFRALGIQPKRTIRAVMFMNEENGGRGAAAYLEQAKEKKESHLFALESDAGGYTPRGFSLDMSSGQMSNILQWKPLFGEYGIHDFVKGGSGSDIGPLKKIGTALAGFIPDSQRYFDLHHAATDTFEAVSKRELHLGAACMGALVWLVSEYGL